jgi:2',3'-cyclic-nucleotide 2'-phosphodiesterase
LILKILFIGDIVGSPGRKAISRFVSDFKKERGVDLCVANAENAAGGSGLTPSLASGLLAAGVDVLTMGDHVWRKREIISAMDRGLPILRPENCPKSAPGKGGIVVTTENGFDVGVVLLLGRVFMKPIDCPFVAADRVVARLAGQTKVILVDMHAEATSEKIAMGWHLDSRVSAVVGTHTHVATADERILPGGTAAITDVGMTGPINSVLGRRYEKVLYHFTTGLPAAFDVATGPVMMNGVLIEVDQETGKAVGIERVRIDTD